MTQTQRNPGQWPDETRLAAWMQENVAGFQGPVALSKFEGGQSNPTFRVDAASGRYVLRRKPLGPVLPSAHAVDREFRVLEAMRKGGVPVADVHALCQDSNVIGSDFYVMDFVDGRVFWDPRLPDMSRDERAAVFASMNSTIAQIHSLDPDAIGLSDFGRKEDYLKRQIARWTRQYEAARTGPNPAMEGLMKWLPEHVPAEHPVRVVHGDYRLDNVLIHPAEPRIVAVLDWELSTLGNPIADFAYHMLSWHFSAALFRGMAGEDLAALGIPDERQYLEQYLASTGLDAPGDWEFYIILSMFRIASILQGIARRSQDGSAANADAAEIGAKAVPISELAWGLVRARND
ncbi:Predicted kinase, aminoglycoside phosphotransferase (APT) family [Lutimaribacter pacificus]|uniref:Predicted kinase, aminoglycoside phosphotransferase (APT) family n=1 Tax=Lutimaribacter pacificus TaxID=391948 RepID=A0A1H0M226_9RHOB|nr:phosphotransferase [Lutimaribacter pacificus]SDO74509.1 Predicted kinase, aminoglycoside phosphotransferase (APT) family [Lutimaribacter pacificus]SHK76890.1 Predicted kinase, aminoglycoside phosphotransferase (APT) family [Lutimaribacter pacificus]